MRSLLFAVILTCLVQSAAAAEAIGGYTNMNHDPGHGTQIEFLSTDGQAFLWYPGNSVILPGKWKKSGSQMCFAYGENTFNPVTGSKGGDFECMPYRLWWGSVEERMAGDVLGLQGRGKVPYKLPKARTTLEKVLARVSPRTKAPEVEVTIITPGTEKALSCSSIVANADRSRDDMAQAAYLYFHGKFMGKSCVKPDYVRAFDLAKKSGVDVEPWLKVLRARAETGNPAAISALRKVGP